MLAKTLEYCKNEVGLDKVMISCYNSNEGSKKIILNAGGVLDKEYEKDGEIVQTYWIRL